MKYLFIDFETDGYYGNIEEVSSTLVSIVDGKYDIEDSCNGFDIATLRKVINEQPKDCTVVFLNKWHIEYIARYNKNVNKEEEIIVKNNIYCFSMILAYILSERYISIAHMTEKLLSREHKGVAESDVVDLMEMFLAVKSDSPSNIIAKFYDK